MKKIHIIEYIFADSDIEEGAYRDLFKIFSSNSNSSNSRNTNNEKNCIYDIMLKTNKDACFIHIENNNYHIDHFDNNLFFNNEQFQKFIKIIKNTQKQIESSKNNYESIFVFSGHCNGWSCYSGKKNVDMKSIRELFIKNNMMFDLICFDGCYSATLDLIYQFTDLSKFIIGHQPYISYEGFNCKSLCNILNNNLDFKEKLIHLAKDFLERSLSEKDNTSITIIECDKFNKLIDLYKKNYLEIRKLIISKEAREFITDLCTPELLKCSDENIDGSCNVICDNMIDMLKLLKLYNNPEMLELYNQSVFYKTNKLTIDNKYFKSWMRYGGINVMINKDNKKIDKHYKNLRFYNDFYKTKKTMKNENTMKKKTKKQSKKVKRH